MIWFNFKKVCSNCLAVLRKMRRILLWVFWSGFICDLFLYSKISDLFFFLLIILWVINVLNYKIKPLKTFTFAAAAFFLAFILQFFGLMVIVEKSASWFFILLSIALIQQMFTKQEYANEI